MRVLLLALAALLACARLGGARGDDEEREVRVAGEPLSAEQQARLVDHARAGGLLWWRLPGEGGYRCEPWRLVPDPGDPERGRLLLVAPPVPGDSPSLPAPADPADAAEQPVPEDSQTEARAAAPRWLSPRPNLLAPAHAAVPEDSSPRPGILLARPSSVPEDSSREFAALLASPPSRIRKDSARLAPAPRSSVSGDISPLTALAWPVFPPAPADGPGPTPEPAPSDMSLGSPTIQLGYRLAEGHLTLTAPEHELPVAAPRAPRRPSAAPSPASSPASPSAAPPAARGG
ncbi:hypothetical protein OV079_29300 [Nannocystis pusilla]|uniref:Uncharacterized protein n=1 Tax=Nannocystis pusilla TaxID=889268 RepID=A0A9X3F1F5_9BACT|nr:hypothetical protein [Nannocystis pusilla]MCY1009591.1 hypothetical protein [Nannocystis pusilla]